MTGIVFEGERAAIVEEFSEILREIGLTRESGDTLTPDMIDALNDFRIANALPEMDFCDPTTLRALGINCTGDEILMLARYADAHAKTEIEMYDLCREVIGNSQKSGISIWEYTREISCGEVTNSAVTAALLALLN